MTHSRVPLACLLAFCGGSFLLHGASAEQAVIDAEKAWSSAVVANDLPTLEKVLSDDLFYGHSSGNTDTKATFISRIRSGAQKYVSFAYDDSPKVKIYGETAVLIGSAQISSVTDGKPNASHLRFLHVFIKHGDAWKLTDHQSVHLPN